jgi:hypothetical protein
MDNDTILLFIQIGKNTPNMIVTKEDVHDGKILKELVGDVLSKNTIFKKI